MILHTAAGREIEHTQDLEIDESETRKLPLFREKYGQDLVERTAPTGFYNCHGMTFALRRAWVFGDGDTINEILNDDNYDEVENPLPGDLILYFGDPSEGIIHSGIVVELTITLPLRIRVCSKWAHSAEFIHWAHLSPYGPNFKFFRVNR